MQWWIRPGPSLAWAMANPSPSPADQMGGRYPDVGERDLAVTAVVGVGEAVDGQTAGDPNPWGVTWDENLALLAVGGRVRIGLPHHDEDRAVRIEGAGGEPLAGR